MDVMEMPIPAATPSKPVSSDDVTRKRRKYQNLEDDSKLGTTLVLGDDNNTSPASSGSTRTPSSTSAKKTITTASGGSPADEVDTSEVDAIPKPKRCRRKKRNVPPPVPAGWLDEICDDDPEPENSEPCEVADANDHQAILLHSESNRTRAHMRTHTHTSFLSECKHAPISQRIRNNSY